MWNQRKNWKFYSRRTSSYKISRFCEYFLEYDGELDATFMLKKVKLSNIKHQSRLKVLHELYYSQYDISATLVEAVFKLIKVQRKTVTWYKMTWNFNGVFSFFWTKVFTHSTIMIHHLLYWTNSKRNQLNWEKKTNSTTKHISNYIHLMLYHHDFTELLKPTNQKKTILWGLYYKNCTMRNIKTFSWYHTAYFKQK